MEHVYATLTLHETGREINEANLTAVLEAAGAEVVESRIKALVAALEGADLDDIATELVDTAEASDETDPDTDDPSVEGDAEPTSGEYREGEGHENASIEQTESFDDETGTTRPATETAESVPASSTEHEA